MMNRQKWFNFKNKSIFTFNNVHYDSYIWLTKKFIYITRFKFCLSLYPLLILTCTPFKHFIWKILIIPVWVIFSWIYLLRIKLHRESIYTREIHLHACTQWYDNQWFLPPLDDKRDCLHIFYSDSPISSIYFTIVITVL